MTQNNLFGLWPHQEKAVIDIENAWRNGNPAVCYQCPTGGGKSRILRTIIDNHANARKTIYIIAHRKNLVKQLSDEIAEADIKHGIIAAGKPYVRYRVQVCSLQTLARRKGLEESDLIVIDECLPPGYLLNGSGAIDKASVGDLISTYDEAGNKIIKSTITKIIKRKYFDSLIKIKCNNKEIVTTKNHPFLTARGWIKAKEINKDDKLLLYLWERNKKDQENMFYGMSTQSEFYNYGQNKQKICFRENEKKQFNVEARSKRESLCNIKKDRSPTKIQRWKRKTNTGTCYENIFKNKKNRIRIRNSCSNKKIKGFRISYMLQDRYSKQAIKNWNRSRREFTQFSKKKNARFKKRKIIKFYGVDNITILQRGSHDYNKAMRGQDYVYNIEVKKTENYIVNGFVIHNCHHAKSKSYSTLIEKWPDALLLGVTATPQRLDGKPLSDVFDHLITGPNMRTLIDQGFLADYEYYAPQVVEAPKHMTGGEYRLDEVAELMDNKKIIGSAVDHYRKYVDGLPAIASCASIAHAEHVAEGFREAGYQAMAVHSRLDDKTIDKALNGLRNGSMQVITQCELLGEGTDIPGATALIGLRHTASLTIFLQHIGRVLRRCDGKEKAIILDHVGNYTRHGLPDDPREWSLDGRQKKDKGELIYKRCPECIRPVPKTSRTCPFCGFMWTPERVGRELPEEAEGELVEVSRPKTTIIWEGLVEEIRLRAGTLKEAIAIAKSYGYRHTAGYVAWTKVLKR